MEQNIIEVDNVEEESLHIKVVKAISQVKRTAERCIGIIKIPYTFKQLVYTGVTVRPEKITPLERGVVGILDIDGTATLTQIGTILGLDIEHDSAEEMMLHDAIETMKNYQMVDEDGSSYFLTDKGKIYAKEGERPVTYTKEFSIFIDPMQKGYEFLKSDFDNSKSIIEAAYTPDFTLSFEEVVRFAERQAPQVQNEVNRYKLLSAEIQDSKCKQKSVEFHVAILQSLREDKTLRVVVFDATQDVILPNLSELITSDPLWIKSLLDRCIELSLNKDEDDGAWILSETKEESSDEQKAIEADVISTEDEELQGKDIYATANELERLHKKSLYDQNEFEVEIDKIFTDDNPDEVWIISPFVGMTFVNKRIKQFEPLLKAGKHIFCAYSETEEGGKPTIKPEIRPRIDKAVNELSSKYSNFYWVELPAFHTKHLLEVKNGQSILFNGSFNILSFDVKQGNIRKEEMSLVHYQTAITKHQDYIDTFGRIFLDEANSKVFMLSDEELMSYDASRLDYFRHNASNKEDFEDFFDKLENEMFRAHKSHWHTRFSEYKDSSISVVKSEQISSSDKLRLKSIYLSLVEEGLKYSIDQDSLEELNHIDGNLSNINVVKDKDSNKSNNGLNIKSIEKSVSDSENKFGEIAQKIIYDKDFSTELAIARYVVALNYMYVNRMFKEKTQATKAFRLLIDNDNACAELTSIAYQENKNGNGLDVSIGVYGLFIRLFSICDKNMAEKINKRKEVINKPRKRLNAVNKNNITNVFRRLIQ